MASQKSPAHEGDENDRPTSAPSGDRRDGKRQRKRPRSADTRPRHQDQTTQPTPIMQQMNSQEENATFSTLLKLRTLPVDYQHAVLLEPGDPMPPPQPPPPRRKIIEEDEKFVWLQRRRTPLPVFNPCVHLVFNQQVIPRDGLSRKEHLDILAAPRELPWRELLEPDPTFYKFRRSQPSWRLPAMAAPSKRYLRGSLRDNFCVLSRPRVQKLVDMLQEEMHVSHKGMSTVIEFLDPAGNLLERKTLKPLKAGRRDKAMDLVAATAIRHDAVRNSKRLRKWAVAVGELVGDQILNWLQEPTIVERTGRLQALAAAALVHLRELAGGGGDNDGGGIPKPRSAANDFLELLAERLALWMNGVLRRSASQQDMRVVAHLRRDHCLRCERPAEFGAGFDDMAVRMPDGLWWYPKPLPPQPEVYPPRHRCYEDAVFNRETQVPSAGSRPPKVPEPFHKPHNCLFDDCGAPKGPKPLSPDEVYKKLYKRYPRRRDQVPKHDCLGILDHSGEHGWGGRKKSKGGGRRDMKKDDGGWVTDGDDGDGSLISDGGVQRAKPKPKPKPKKSMVRPFQPRKPRATQMPKISIRAPVPRLPRASGMTRKSARPSIEPYMQKLKKEQDRRQKGLDRGRVEPDWSRAMQPSPEALRGTPFATQPGMSPDQLPPPPPGMPAPPTARFAPGAAPPAGGLAGGIPMLPGPFGPGAAGGGPGGAGYGAGGGVGPGGGLGVGAGGAGAGMDFGGAGAGMGLGGAGAGFPGAGMGAGGPPIPAYPPGGAGVPAGYPGAQIPSLQATTTGSALPGAAFLGDGSSVSPLPPTGPTQIPAPAGGAPPAAAPAPSPFAAPPPSAPAAGPAQDAPFAAPGPGAPAAAPYAAPEAGTPFAAPAADAPYPGPSSSAPHAAVVAAPAAAPGPYDAGSAPYSAPAAGSPYAAPEAGAPNAAPVAGAPIAAPAAGAPIAAPAAGTPYAAPAAGAPYAAPAAGPPYAAPAAGAPYAAPAAGAPYAAPAAGAPYAAPAAGAPYAAPAAGAPYAAPAAGAPYAAPAAGAPYAAPAASAPYAAPAASAPYASPAAGAPYSAPAAGTPYAAPAAGAPYAAPSAGAPYAAPSAGAPYAAPAAGAPYAAPAAGAPYVSPAAGAPYAAPAAGTPYAAPAAGTPYAAPAAGSPYAAPAAGAPYGAPGAGTPYGAPTASAPYGAAAVGPYPAGTAYPGTGPSGAAYPGVASSGARYPGTGPAGSAYPHDSPSGARYPSAGSGAPGISPLPAYATASSYTVAPPPTCVTTKDLYVAEATDVKGLFRFPIIRPVIVAEDEADKDPELPERYEPLSPNVHVFGPTKDRWEEFVYHVHVLGEEGCLEVDRLDEGHPLPNCILRAQEEDRILSKFYPPGYTDAPCCESLDTDLFDDDQYIDIDEDEDENKDKTDVGGRDGDEDDQTMMDGRPCPRVPAGFAPEIWRDPAEDTCEKRIRGGESRSEAVRLLNHILASMPTAIKRAAKAPVTELRKRLSGYLFGYLKQLIDGNPKIGPASQDIAGMVSDEVAAWLESICMDAKRACDAGLDSDTVSKKIAEAMEVFYQRWENEGGPCTCVNANMAECAQDCADTCAQAEPVGREPFSPVSVDAVLAMASLMS